MGCRMLKCSGPKNVLRKLLNLGSRFRHSPVIFFFSLKLRSTLQGLPGTCQRPESSPPSPDLRVSSSESPCPFGLLCPWVPVLPRRARGLSWVSVLGRSGGGRELTLAISLRRTRPVHGALQCARPRQLLSPAAPSHHKKVLKQNPNS